MINAKEELLKFLKENKISTNEILCFELYILTQGLLTMKVGEKFETSINKLDFYYEPNENRQILKGTVWLTNNRWLERINLDEFGNTYGTGNVWYYLKRPKMSNNLMYENFKEDESLLKIENVAMKVYNQVSKTKYHDEPKFLKYEQLSDYDLSILISDIKYYYKTNETPEQFYNKNLEKLKSYGWHYGKDLNIDYKSSPLVLEYKKLPFYKRLRDAAFISVCDYLKSYLNKEAQQIIENYNLKEELLCENNIIRFIETLEDYNDRRFERYNREIILV